MNYYVHECLGPSIPYIQVRSLPNNTLVRNLHTNGELEANSREKIFPRRLKLRIALQENAPWKNGHPDKVDVELFLPPGLREDDTLTYPLVIQT